MPREPSPHVVLAINLTGELVVVHGLVTDWEINQDVADISSYGSLDRVHYPVGDRRLRLELLVKTMRQLKGEDFGNKTG